MRAYPESGLQELSLADADLVKDEDRTCATHQFTAADASLESLSNDLGNLLDQNSSADVELRCAEFGYDGKILATVKAHKLVVCARSPVLNYMLHNSEMVGDRPGVATVRGIDAGVFKQSIRYLYSGKLGETTVDTAMSLYKAGKSLVVASLTKHCAHRLARDLTIENSCEVLVFAGSHGDEELTELTLTFMVDRKVPQAFVGWGGFCSSHPSLAIRVLNRMCKGKSIEDEYRKQKDSFVPILLELMGDY